MWEGDNLVVIGLSNGVTVNLNLFSNRVGSNLDGANVVSMSWS